VTRLPRTPRLAAAALGIAGLAASYVVAASSGSLATASGTLSFAPASGNDATDITVTTSAACPQAATNVIVKVTGGDAGPSHVTDGIIVGNTAISAYAKTPGGGIVIPLTQSFHDFAQASGFTPIQGTYAVTVTCRTAADPASLLDFASGLAWTAGASAFTGTYQAVASTVATTTTLQVTPPGPVAQGSAVTLHATLSPGGAAGSVRFKDGTTDLGTPVTVTAGTADLVTSSLPAGSRSLTAVFTPADSAAYGASTSSAVPYVVTAAPPAFLPTVFPAPRVGVASTCVVSASNATTVAYAWLRNGVVVAGATGATHTPPDSEYHAALSCRVTASNADNPPLVGTSPAVSVGVGPALRATAAPYLSGTVRVGSRVYCMHGTWSPAATSYLYGWRLDGRAVTGTASSLVPPASWRGHYVSCAVTARRTAWSNGVASSKQAKVA
jgi:hypothetical protein